MDVQQNQPMIYRMKTGGFVWHFKKDCDLYPKEYYEEKTVTTPEDFMIICIKCSTLLKEIDLK